MENQGSVTKKRFRAKPYDQNQMLEVAYYVAAKRRQPMRVYKDKAGLYMLTSDLTKYIAGEVYEVRNNGELYLASKGVNLPVKEKQEEAVKIAVKHAPRKKAGTVELMVPTPQEEWVMPFAYDYNPEEVI